MLCNFTHHASEEPGTLQNPLTSAFYFGAVVFILATHGFALLIQHNEYYLHIVLPYSFSTSIKLLKFLEATKVFCRQHHTDGELSHQVLTD